MKIAKKLITGSYRFIVDASSTMREDEEAQSETLTQIMGFYLQNPQVVDQLLQQDGYQFNFGETFKSYIYNSGVNDPESIVSKVGQDGQTLQMQPAQIDPNRLNQIDDPNIRAVAQQLFSQQSQQPQMQGAM